MSALMWRKQIRGGSVNDARDGGIYYKSRVSLKMHFDFKRENGRQRGDTIFKFARLTLH